MLKVVVAAGGTAGHLYPGLSVAEILRSAGGEVLFIGKLNGPEARIVGKCGFDFKGIRIIGRSRGMVNARNLRAAIQLVGATASCMATFRSFKPDVVMGAGGYVSLPADLAAKLSGIPLVLHEQNAVPGLANRIAGRFAKRIAVGFAGTEGNFGPKAVLTGNPVRSEIRDMNRHQARTEGLALFGLDSDRRTLLIFGGSQGALSINRAALAAFQKLRHTPIQVLHLTGPTHVEGINAQLLAAARDRDVVLWRTFGYLDRMDLAYACADLAICRSGASTIAELAATGLPCLLVPLPVALDDDQRHNAEVVSAAGGAKVILDSDLGRTDLSEVVKEIIEDESTLTGMSAGIATLDMPDAAVKLANLVVESAA
ncbi:MAG: undecaprenyldiphospho-muramoylpentapeptide beta-N-acetylglucosaminyltransferase [Actinomycetota bacterium]